MEIFGLMVDTPLEWGVVAIPVLAFVVLGIGILYLLNAGKRVVALAYAVMLVLIVAFNAVTFDGLLTVQSNYEKIAKIEERLAEYDE